MYYLKVEGHFDAAHRLVGYQGKCANMHGHRWKYSVVVKKDQLDRLGMVMDFLEVKNGLNPIVGLLDHTVLNDSALLKGNNPTAENLASAIYNQLKKDRILGSLLESVTIWESPECSCTYKGV
jgi:6-pyruvoyltetrahydropterin/6-carboxytetrahydropterin synthase